MVRPKKRRCLFQVTLPYLTKHPDPKVFVDFEIYSLKWRKISKTRIFPPIQRE